MDTYYEETGGHLTQMLITGKRRWRGDRTRIYTVPSRARKELEFQLAFETSSRHVLVWSLIHLPEALPHRASKNEKLHCTFPEGKSTCPGQWGDRFFPAPLLVQIKDDIPVICVYLIP